MHYIYRCWKAKLRSSLLGKYIDLFCLVDSSFGESCRLSCAPYCKTYQTLLFEKAKRFEAFNNSVGFFIGDITFILLQHVASVQSYLIIYCFKFLQVQKKKIWELVQPHLKTDASCTAMLGEHLMQTSTGVVVCKSLKNANIS